MVQSVMSVEGTFPVVSGESDGEQPGGLRGFEQDNTVSSSSGVKCGFEETGELSSSSASSMDDLHEEEFKSVIDLLEQRVSSEEMTTGESDSGSHAHSVEYWSVGQKGKPKALLKRYSANSHRQSRRQSVLARRWNNAPTGSLMEDPYGSEVYTQRFNTSFVPTSFVSPSPCQGIGNQLFPQVPSPQLYPIPVPASVPQPPLPSIQIFIPPEHSSWTPNGTHQPFLTFPSVNPTASTAFLPYPQQQQQSFVQYYATTPLQQNAFPTAIPSTPSVPYYQGPLFYPIPSHLPPVGTLNPLAPPFNSNYLGSYEILHEYPPPPYEDVMNSSGASHEQPSTITEVDFTTTETKEPVSDNKLYQFQTCLLTPVNSPAATPSSSETCLSDINASGFNEANGSISSGYSSCLSSPVTTVSETRSPTPGNNEAAAKATNVDNGTSCEELPELGLESTALQSNENNFPPQVMDISACSLERYPMELRALNNVCSTGVPFLPQVYHPTIVSPHHQNLMVYPGDCCILMYSQNDGKRIVLSYAQEEIPYVCNVFDIQVQANFKEQCGPALSYPYYVPPQIKNNDYFGGQLPIWQLKMGQYFLKYQPHNWRMHGVPEIFNTDLFLGRVMDATGEFHIVSKLRFSCKTCKTPWTSKKGTIVFKFCYNSAFQHGWILMKIFGQVCMRDECSDWSFQNPACYPEEIDRAMRKLSEYIGNQCYGISVTPSCFDECFKSIRRSGNVGNNNSVSKEREKLNLAPTPHKREFCQACLNGVCKNIFAKPFPAVRKLPRSSS